jgi:hypothetical protein
MSTESVLIHDGSQCVAAANYGNGAGLAGSNTGGTTGGASGSGQYLAVVLTAAGRTVAVAAAIGAQIYGILQNKPALGQAADVGIIGITKAVAGGTIAAGAALMTNASGALITWTAGSGYAQIGTAIEAAVSGQVFTAAISMADPKALT